MQVQAHGSVPERVDQNIRQALLRPSTCDFDSLFAALGAEASKKPEDPGTMAPPPVPTLKPKSAHVPVSEQGSDAPTPTPRGSEAGSMDVDQARVFGLKLIVSLSRSNTGYML